VIALGGGVVGIWRVRGGYDVARAAVRADPDDVVGAGRQFCWWQDRGEYEAGKNLVGAFYQPRMVLADTGSLATLPPRELRAGWAEIIKAGLIGDAAFFCVVRTVWAGGGRRRSLGPGRGDRKGVRVQGGSGGG